MLRSAAPRRGSATLDGFNALIGWDANQRRFGPSIDQALQRVFRHDQPSCPSRPPIGSWCAASQHPCYTDRFVDLVGEGLELRNSRRFPRRLEPDRTADRADPWKARRRPPDISGRMALPKRLTNCSRINVSCKAPRRGTSSTETRRSPCIRKVD